MNLNSLWASINGWDMAITKFLNVNLSSPILDGIMIFVTMLGNGIVAAAIVAAVLALNQETKKSFWSNFLKALGAMALAGIVVQLIKFGVNRHRPLEHVAELRLVWESAIWRSFPSGHTATAFSAAGFLSNKIRRYVWIFFCVATLIGISRVYTAVHYPTDVIAGALIGVAASRIILMIENKIRRNKIPSTK